MTRVVIIGAGFGGLGAAKTFADAQLAGVESVVVLDKKSEFTIGGSWQYAWSGRVRKEDTTWPLADAAPQLPGIDLRLNVEVAALDLERKTVRLADGSEVAYDRLILAPGVVGDPSGVPGMADRVDMYSHPDVARQESDLADIIARAKSGEPSTLCVSIGAVPYKCPVAPFEAAFIAVDKLAREGVRDEVRVVVTSPVAWPLPDPARDIFEAHIAEKGVEFWPEAPLASIETDGTTDESVAAFAAGSNREPLAATKLWTVYPQVAPAFVRDAGLTNPRGFVPVDVRTNAVEGRDGVYCVGDCCAIAVGGKPHPKAGEFAWQMGEMVAHDIMATAGYEHSRLGACIAECGGGAGVLVAPDYTAVVKDPSSGKPSCQVADKRLDGEAAKLAWVNKYVGRIFGEGGRTFEPSAAGA